MVVDFKNEPLTDFSKEENRRAFEEALRKVEAELGREYDLIIGGERIKTDRKVQSINPSNIDQVVGVVSQADTALAEKAVQAALKAFETWKRVRPKRAPATCSRPRPSCAGASTSFRRGWSMRPARAGPRPTPTRPRRSTSWNTTAGK
jgi:NAD-dependent aldehyde dehydrogenases